MCERTAPGPPPALCVLSEDIGGAGGLPVSVCSLSQHALNTRVSPLTCLPPGVLRGLCTRAGEGRPRGQKRRPGRSVGAQGTSGVVASMQRVVPPGGHPRSRASLLCGPCGIQSEVSWRPHTGRGDSGTQPLPRACTAGQPWGPGGACPTAATRPPAPRPSPPGGLPLRQSGCLGHGHRGGGVAGARLR